ncbi:unnamed protein product [Allacma fusca]|uniref:Uncharacterized protein n=1 Tax=Allacma fusca TaxID=39272 RepID=A0A8J2KTN0_9HEXA|nr:unnamed protein product [Allacma fusca]
MSQQSFLCLSVLLVFTLRPANSGQMRSEEYFNSYSRDYSQKPAARQLSSTGTAYVEDDFGNYAAASGGHGHGHGGGGGGHGGGHGGGYGGGWGHGGGGGGYGGGGGGHGKKADCNSALGLLGVLGLASYLQSVLRQTTTTMMMMMMPPAGGGGGRKKRDTEGTVDHVRITTKVLPMLSAIGHARDGLIPHHCVHEPICKANRILVDELGEGHGSSVASMVSHAAAKFLNQGNKDTKNSKFLLAAKTGRSKGDCNDYQHCQPLDSLPTYGVPPSGMF